MKIQILTPITKPIRQYEFIALDAEGTGKAGDFICAATWDESGGQLYKDRTQLKRALFHTSNLRKRIVCANLEYDYAVCFQPFHGSFNITLANRKWLKASYHDNSKHAWTAFDIQRIVPMSVAQMGNVLGIPKWDTPPALVSRSGYKANEWKCGNHNRLWCVDCYCMRDAEITYKFTRFFQDSVIALGGELQLTAASTAMDLFKRRFLHDEIPGCLPNRNDLARDAYYGGRVEVYTLGTSADVHAYDINSLYPSVMRDVEIGLPNTYRRSDRPKRYSQYLDQFGHLSGTITLPKAHVGLLPVRIEGRLYFPTGKITGSWMLSEVRHALEHGAKLNDVSTITYTNTTMKLFSEYVDTLYNLRLQMQATNDPQQVAIKLYLNSLYGKFAQRTDTELQTLIAPPKYYSLNKYDGCEPVIIAGRELFLRGVPNDFQPAHIQVAWAGEITSHARQQLYNYLTLTPDKLVYCDTDSIHTYGKLPVSKQLGGLKLEYDFGRVTYFAPKEYGGQTTNGIMIHRAKGIPFAEREAYLTNGSVTFQQPLHTLTAIKRGRRIAEWIPVEKKRRSDAMNRSHKTLSDYNKGQVKTYPYEGEDLT